MMRIFKKVYLKVGLHTAAEGKLLYSLHIMVRGFYKRIFSNAMYLAIARTAAFEPASSLRPFWSRKASGCQPYMRGVDRGYQYWDKLRPSNKVSFDIGLACREMQVGGIALVLFMGMGDYLFITPLLKALRQEFKDTPIHAYLSTSTDKTNAALISKLIEHNPDIDQVCYYTGGRSKASDLDWRNYNYQEVLTMAPADFLVVPVLYEYTANTRHRVYSLFETFSLARPERVPPPIIYLPGRVPSHVTALYENIRSAYGVGCKGVVFIQLDARSTNYIYPHIDKIVESLVERGFLIVSVTPFSYRKQDRVFIIDIKQLSIVDSIQLLQMVSIMVGDRLNLLTVTSVFGSVSAGLGIRNLQMWHADDEAMPSMWYPVHHVVARMDYPSIPQNSITVASPDNYTINERGLADYNPDFVLKTFMDVLIAKTAS